MALIEKGTPTGLLVHSTPGRNQRSFAGFVCLCTLLLFPAPANADDESGSITAENLAAVPAKIVENQMRAATTQADAYWASQPGAIRTFRDGQLSRIYKLYSAPDLLAPSAAEAQADLALDWDQKPHHFVDLNRPMREGNELQFPIADPRADAEGFTYRDELSGVILSGAGAEDDRRLPMPVSWLYILEDGHCGYLDGANRFVGGVVPSAENPIVGRVAFWADDLTCKLNVNTASEGVYWDTPRTDTTYDRALANSQPAAGEYQRHTGHPATVSLSSVLYPGNSLGINGETSTLSLDEAEVLWRIGNGIGTGGSKGGTVPNEDIQPTSGTPSSYAPRTALDQINDAGITPEMQRRIDRGDFFLTTENSASELNFRGHPRISTWPLHSDSFRHTHFDQHFDAVSSLNGAAFHIARTNSLSRHWEVYQYNEGRAEATIAWLSSALEENHPADGRSLGTKYGIGPFSESAQIVTDIATHSLCANILDPWASNFTYTRRPGEWGSGQVTGPCRCGGTAHHSNRWDNPDLPYPLAMGRQATLSEVALVFFVTAFRREDGTGAGEDWGRLDPGEKAIGLGILLECFCPSHGSPALASNMSVTLGLPAPPVEIDGQSLGTLDGSGVLRARQQTSFGGQMGVESLVDGQLGITWEPHPSRPLRPSIPIDAEAFEVAFLGQDPELRLELFDDRNNQSDGNLTRVITISLPNSAAVAAPAAPDSVDTWSQRLFASRSDPGTLTRDSDSIRSFLLPHGDVRLLAATRATGANMFKPHPDFFDITKRHAHSLTFLGGKKAAGFCVYGQLSEADYPERLVPDVPYAPGAPLFTPAGVNYPFPSDPSETGDFDNGFGDQPDGPYLNRSDDGDVFHLDFISRGTAYFDGPDPNIRGSPLEQFHAPHRITPGPVSFGSLPTGVRAGIPWRTLLFRPDPQHFGASSAADHLWLDLFRMPAPLPLAESKIDAGASCDLFSSSGKINLNHQFLPFTHITRATGIHAMMKSERIIAIPTGDGMVYKSPGGPESYRHRIDVEETLGQWEHKFAEGEIFRTASEICEMYLVPEGEQLGEQSDGDYPAMRAFWADHKLTGDNTKERPYAALYQHATTRSNSFQVHFIAQPIQKGQTAPHDVFDPASDFIVAEARGSQVVARSLDDFGLPDPVTEPADSFEHNYTYSASAAETFAGPPFAIESVGFDGEGFLEISWPTEPGALYLVQRSIDLKNWESRVELESGGAAILYFRDDDPPSEASVNYRVVRRYR